MAKQRINMRFDRGVLEKLDAEVARRRKKKTGADGAPEADRTALMQELCRAGLGMPPVAEDGTSSTPGSNGAGGAGRTRARPKRSAASADPPKAKPKAKAKKAPAPKPARVSIAALAGGAQVGAGLGHRPSCKCNVCKPQRTGAAK